MKKITVLMVSAVALVSVACGTKSDPPAVSTTTTTYRATTTTMATSSVDAYVSAMRVFFPRASRSELIDLGKTACDTVTQAGSITDALVDIVTDPSWAGMEGAAAYTIGAAVPTFCPRYLPELKALTR